MRSFHRLGLVLSCQVFLIVASELAASAQTCSHLVFRFGAPSSDCGFPGLGLSGSGPFSGALLDGSQAAIPDGDLGLGCLHFGGGLSQQVPPGPVPEGGATWFAVDDCSLETLTLQPADTGDRRTCTLGPTTARRCLNGHPGTDGDGLCTTDADCAPLCIDRTCTGGTNPGVPCSGDESCTGGVCRGDCVNGPGNLLDGKCDQDFHCGLGTVSGVCQPEPRCTFAAPIPLENSGVSTCQLTVVRDGVGGTAHPAVGSASLNVPLQSWVYLTGVTYGPKAPCPTCVESLCSGGRRAGQPCTTSNGALTSHDCPPADNLFLAAIDLNLSPLTTGTATATDASGLFCEGQENNAPGSAGAFGVTAARTIVENGSSASGGFVATPRAVTLASVFCLPGVGYPLLDFSHNVPGPGALALAGTIELASGLTTTSFHPTTTQPSSTTTTVVTPSTTSTTLACAGCSIDIAEPGRRKTTATCTMPPAPPDGAQCAGNGTSVASGEVVIDPASRPLKTKRKQSIRTATVKLKLNALGKALLKANGTLAVRVTAAIVNGSQTPLEVEEVVEFRR